MTTFVNQAKNSVNWVNQTENLASFVNQAKNSVNQDIWDGELTLWDDIDANWDGELWENQTKN